MAETLGIGVVGAGGRMGQMLVGEIAATADCRLAGATEQKGSPALGRDAGELAGVGTLGVAIGDDPDALFATADAVIDFTAPAASVAHAALAAKHKKIHVIGTTGLDAAQEKALGEAARGADHRLGAQYEFRRQPGLRADRAGRAHPRARLGHRDRRDAPQAQGRCAVGHGARPRPRRGRRDAASTWNKSASACATA